MKSTLRLSLCGLLFLAACKQNKSGGGNAIASLAGDKDVLESVVLPPDSLRTFPFVAERVNAIEKTLQTNSPVLLLADTLTAQQQQAQQLAVASAAFLFYSKEAGTNAAYRNEIFGVYPARESDFTGVNYNWRSGQCFRVEMYNYALNLTSIALVDVTNNKVAHVNHFPQSQPDLPVHLKDLATAIAVASPEVVAALGYQPGNKDALMAGTKTSLNRTRCERSRHLCVAPTFVKDGKALWAIVDLTEHRLVGIRWTNTETTGPGVITERRLQNDKLTACFCEQETKLEKEGWAMNYMLTSSDGLRISNVQFNGKPVLQSAKLVDWHVSYSNSDGFGYSDAVGCPEFSHAAVIATAPPVVLALKDEAGAAVGFVLEQSYASEGWPTPCNYNYKQRYEFYKDGRFRISCASLGRGCGNDGTYRPVFRMALPDASQNIAEWNGSQWAGWTTEKWQLQTGQTAYTPEGYQYKLSTPEGGYYIEPGKGQFGDGGRGDNAFFYATRWHADKDEGDADLVTIGPCCNTDYHQGPEKFIEPAAENIQNTKLVLWYVAQLKNDNTRGREYCWAESFINKTGAKETKIYPCFAGPMFTPIKK
jgi:hypothetical protein